MKASQTPLKNRQKIFNLAAKIFCPGTLKIALKRSNMKAILLSF